MDFLAGTQWLFLVPLKGGRWHCPSPNWQEKYHLLSIYHLYIAFWGVICYRSHLFGELLKTRIPKDPFVCPKNLGLARSIPMTFSDGIGTRKILFDREGSLGSLGDPHVREKLGFASVNHADEFQVPNIYVSQMLVKNGDESHDKKINITLNKQIQVYWWQTRPILAIFWSRCPK